MKANIAEIAQSFARDGFVVVPNLFRRAEVKVFKDGIQKILDEVRQEDGGEGSRQEMLDATGVYVGLAGRSGLFRQAVRDERLLDILEAVIGPNVEFLSDKVVYKDTHTHVASPWHQEWPYWEGTHKISVWVALDDATPENGSLKFLPGSHRGSVIHDGTLATAPVSATASGLKRSMSARAVSVPLEAGGAAFFHDLTMHASHPIRSAANGGPGCPPIAMRRPMIRPIRSLSPMPSCAASGASEREREVCQCENQSYRIG